VSDAISLNVVSEVRDAVDQARAREYSLLSTLLIRSPDAVLLVALAGLQSDDTPLGKAHAALAKAAARTDAHRIEREYFDLFVGVGRGEILPYASFYQTGFLHGRPLAQLRELLRRIGIERSDSLTEPEDHAAVLLEMMASLASGAIAAPSGTERELFEIHLAPWIGRLFKDLEQAKAADFYACVGALGTLFMSIESEAFTLPT
jgi:TorA maturation chaperone TorD